MSRGGSNRGGPRTTRGSARGAGLAGATRILSKGGVLIMSTRSESIMAMWYGVEGIVL